VLNIETLCRSLHLSYIGKNYREHIGNASLSKEDFLCKLLEREYETRIENGISRRVKEAKFPYKKFLCDFKRNKYPEEFLPEFAELETLDFITKNENIILLGTTGAGKTHYSIALGMAACTAGKSVFFANVANLVTDLKEAMSSMQITSFRRKFERYSLVILDELGYISFDKSGAELLFNLISSRNDKGSIIVTSNLSFDRWEEVFHDPTLTAAAVDRLCHRGHILDISRDKGGRFEDTVSWLENRSGSSKSIPKAE